MSFWHKFVQAAASTRAGAWFIVNVLFRLDGALLKISGGRVFLAMGWDMLLLTTTGAKSGKPRTIPLLYIVDEKNIVLIASNGGREKFPAWYWNLRAHPHAVILAKGRSGNYFAREAKDSERARLWKKAVGYFGGYALYEKRVTTREIPVMVLTPKER